MDFVARSHFNDLRRYNEKSMLEFTILVRYAIQNEDTEILELLTSAFRDLRRQVYDKLMERRKSK